MSSKPDKKSSILDQLSASIAQSYQAGPRAMHHIGGYELPQRGEVEWCIETVRAVLLPGFVGAPVASENPEVVEAYVRERLENLQGRLCAQLYRGLHHRCAALEDRTVDCVRCAEKARAICTQFMEGLPELRAALATDVEAAYEGDPAATGTDEVIFCYPGLYAITCYRMANRLLRDGASIIPRMITEHAHEKTGIDIHPGASIGKWFFIDHGRHRHRRNDDDRRARPHLPGRHLGRPLRAEGQSARRGIEETAPDHRRRGHHLRQCHHPRRRNGDRTCRGDRRKLLGHGFRRARRAPHGGRPFAGRQARRRAEGAIVRLAGC